MEIQDFAKYYKSISNEELLNILENPDGYQPAATEAAKKEFLGRQLSEEEIKDAKESAVRAHLHKEVLKTGPVAIEEKVKTTARSLFEALNPVQAGLQTTEKTLRALVLFFSIIFVCQAVNDRHYIVAYAQDIVRFPLLGSWVLFSLILLPVSIINFWKRKTVGWTLLTIYLTFSAVGRFWDMVHSLNRPRLNFSALNNLYPRTSLTTYLVQMLFFAALYYILCKKDIRAVFQIKKEMMVKTIVLTAMLTFLLHFLI